MTELYVIHKVPGADKWTVPPDKHTFPGDDILKITIGGRNFLVVHSKAPHEIRVVDYSKRTNEVDAILPPNGGKPDVYEFTASDGTMYRLYHGRKNP